MYCQFGADDVLLYDFFFFLTDVTLAGLELGLLTMKKGEFSRFLFKPQYAYGNMGCPPRIPADAVVLYEVEVLDFLDSGQVDDFTALSPVGALLVYNLELGIIISQ